MVERASPVKGLATIAMLKARYDKGQDHIDMFQPFLDDAIRSAPTDELKLEEVRTRIETQHGLRVPLGTLSVLLTRAKRRGVVRLMVVDSSASQLAKMLTASRERVHKSRESILSLLAPLVISL